MNDILKVNETIDVDICDFCNVLSDIVLTSDDYVSAKYLGVRDLLTDIIAMERKPGVKKWLWSTRDCGTQCKEYGEADSYYDYWIDNPCEEGFTSEYIFEFRDDRKLVTVTRIM